MITYHQGTMPNVTVVRLAGKQCGIIREFKTKPCGFRYEPKGSSLRGELYPTLAACKRSLEAA